MSLKNLKGINYCYILLGAFIIFEILHILKSKWGGDFFEHSAVITELSRNLTTPNNPIIKSEIPHAFFSPYALLTAFFSKITTLNSIQTLEVFGVFNLIFFVLAFYFFFKKIAKKNYKIVASVALILSLVFWGYSPIKWSGFYHIYTLHQVLPYPSTFAMALSFLTLGFVAKYNSQNIFFNTYSLIIIFFNTIVLLTHPTTAISLFIAIVVLSFTFKNYSFKSAVLNSLILIIPSLLLCLIWPYFSVIRLFTESGVTFHEHSLILYSNFFEKNWPITFIIPILFFSKKDAILNFFSISSVLLLVVYFGGYMLKIYGFSRAISGAMLFAHFSIAYYVVALKKPLKLKDKIYTGALYLALVISIGSNYMQLGYVVYGIFKKKDITYYQKYAFLKNHINENSLVLSDTESNWIIPTYQGKVISSEHPLYWVNDITKRRNAIYSFFDKETSDSTRLSILQSFQPSYLLIDYSNVEFKAETYKWLKTISQSIYKKENMELFKLNFSKQYD